MKRFFKQVGAIFLSVMLVFSSMVVGVSAATTPPTTIKSVVSQNSYRLYFFVSFEEEADWLNAITEVSAGDTAYEEVEAVDRSARYLKNIWHADAEKGILYISDEKDGTTTFTVKAEGYSDAIIEMGEGVYNSGYGTTTYSNATISEVGGGDEEPEIVKGIITLDQISIGTDFFGNDWILSFIDAEGYAEGITEITVNDEAWESYFTAPSSGGKYYADASNNQLTFAKTNFGSVPVLKSGDIVSIENSAYETITFKVVIDPSGNMTFIEDDGLGDPYNLYLKLEGSFEAAIKGQKDYDGASGASTSVSINKNSAATIYAALVEGDRPADDSEVWQELNLQNEIEIEVNTARVHIVPDVEAGTSADADSGMSGIYMRLSSDLTLSGTPQDPGQYLIYVTLKDVQGREATSNALPFRIYSGEEKLVDQIQIENLTPTVWDGKYMWNIMEPWSIVNFGSNVEGEDESVRIPADLKAWYGSNESGVYGNLGYAIPWEDVEAGNIPQTLYIPAGCNLTFVNMEIQSSVRIVVEEGATLVLRDSVVQGIIDVESGGTFSMNYDGFSDPAEFLTGASVDGQIRLQDGAILENAAIYSHTNYIANGDADTRDHSEPVVVSTGDVTVKGQVFIRGDEAGTKDGQTALKVKDGILTLEEDAVLAVYGGDAKVTLYQNAGSALVLENGTVTGEGKLIAIGGAPFWGNGGDAVTGEGTISTKEAYLQGSTAISDGPTGKKNPGKAVDGDVSVTSPWQHVQDGTNITVSESNTLEGGDPLYALYWKTGIDPTPNLDLYPTEEVIVPPVDEDDEVEATHKRIAGANRYETAIQVAEELKAEKNVEKFANIVVAYGGDYPDALASGYLAKTMDAPVLLVAANQDARIMEYVTENLEEGGTVYLIGGTGVVSEGFESALDESGAKVERLGGANRYETNLKILEKAGVKGEELLIASATGYADSLSASAAGRPILLVGGALTEEQKSFIKEMETEKIYLIGGTGVVSQDVEDTLNAEFDAEVTRVAGVNRYETSVAVAKAFFGEDADTVVLTYAMNFPDGLSGSALAMEVGAPLVLADITERGAETAKNYVTGTEIKNSITLGGETLISDDVVNAMFE